MSRPGQQPVSYRTVPGRHRTQKWQAASKQTYDGDDWGGYDPYEEYDGAAGEDAPQDSMPPPLPQQQQQQQFGRPTRTNSFDRGDEGRLFTAAGGPAAPAATAPFPTYDPQAAQHPAPNSGRTSHDDPRARGPTRIFTNPEHVPPPLMTRPSPASAERFPPRKSSLSGGSPTDIQPTTAAAPTLATTETAPAAAQTSAEKPLPFIRPSDIYKRMAEERERERRSEESSRPSMDSVQREPDQSAPPAPTAGPRTNLATVAESRESRLFMDEPSKSGVANEQAPLVAAGGALGSTDLQHQPSQGFRSAVHHAFDHADSTSSLSRDGSLSASETVSRSNTTSTAAISPIMSNVPLPPLASNVTHLANLEPGYRRSLDPPSTEQSPAHTPLVEDTASKRLSSPMTAETVSAAGTIDVPDQSTHFSDATLRAIETSAGESSHPAVAALPVAGRGRSGTDYSIREADLANTINASQPKEDGLAQTVADEARANQELFLSTHAGTPTTPLSSNAAPGSPSKGRVREIADQYQEIHNSSRRNSASSIGSNKSRKGTIPDIADVEATSQDVRPAVDRGPSFRPEIPGGWISPAPTPMVERPNEPASRDQAHLSLATNGAEQPLGHAEPLDLTPTTQRGVPHEVPASDAQAPFSAVKNAGDELGAALMASVGMGHQTRDFASSEPPQPVQQPERHNRAGPVSTIPPVLRQETGDSDVPTSVESSLPPSPLPKDTPTGQGLNPSAPQSGHRASGYFGSSVPPLRLSSRQNSAEPLDRAAEQAPSHAANTLSVMPGPGDTESDRLRKEIVRSLGSQEGESTEDLERIQEAPNVAADASHASEAHPPATTETASRPGFLTHRFSWETAPAQAQTSAAHAAPAPAPVPTIVQQSEPESPEIRPERAYERPRSSVLQVVNTSLDEDTSPVDEIPVVREPDAEDAGHQQHAVGSAAGQDILHPSALDVESESAPAPMQELAPEHVSERATSVDSGPRLPSYYLGNDQLEPAVPHPEPENATPSTTAPPPSEEPTTAKPAQIPPFRTILGMKSCDDRIRTYNETRQTFADMNTGLSQWLAGVIESRPEHAGIASGQPLALQTSGVGTFKRGHKQSPSIMKFGNKFTDNQRLPSGSTIPEESAPTPQRHTTVPGNEKLDMDKVQQKGKDFMKSAGVFGGKAQAGAKGLFAKGKSRFGSRKDSDKAFSAPSIPSTAVFSSPLPPPTLPVTNKPTALRGGGGSGDDDGGSFTPPRRVTPSPKPQAADTYFSSLRPSLSLSSHSRTSSAAQDAASSHRHRTPLSHTLSLFRTQSRSKSKAKSKSPGPGLARSNTGLDPRPTSLILPAADPAMLQQHGLDMSKVTDESEFRRPDTSSTSGDPGASIADSQKERREAWEEGGDEAASATATGNATAPGTWNQPLVANHGSRPGASESESGTGARSGKKPRFSGTLQIPSNTAIGAQDLGVDLGSIMDRRRHLERLGVLPSPAETTRTFEFGPSPPSSAHAASASATAPTAPAPDVSPTLLRRSRGGGELDEMEKLKGLEEEMQEQMHTGDKRMSAASPQTSPVVAVPGRERKGSDLALLPSQQLRRQSGAWQAQTNEAGGDNLEVMAGLEADNEVHDASRITVKPVQPILVTAKNRKDNNAGDAALPTAPSSTTKKPKLLGEDVHGAGDSSVDVGETETESSRLARSNISDTPVATVRRSDIGDEKEKAIRETVVRAANDDPSLEPDTAHKRPQPQQPEVKDEPPPEQSILHANPVQPDRNPDQPLRTESWDDRRSEVSAEDVGHSTEPARRDSAVSRRSSVSSLGGPALAIATSGFYYGDMAEEEETPVMSAQAVPAGPLSPSVPATPTAADRAPEEASQQPELERMNSREALDYHQRFANRTYQQRPQMERPLSYVPLQRDSAGVPIQETLPATDVLKTGSRHVVHPPSALSRHSQAASRSAVRTVQPTEYERLRTSIPVSIEPDSVPLPKPSNEAKPRKAGRFSALLRKNRQTDERADSSARPVSSIDVEYPDQALESQALHEDKHGRRRSVVMEAILAVRRPSVVSQKDFGRDESIVDVQPDNNLGQQNTEAEMSRMPEASKSRPSTLRKPPQRSASTASSKDLEPKKKRFSGLGMLFGRSSTTGHATPKPTRLSKMPPPVREDSRRQAAPATQPGSEDTVTGNIRGYEAFEALRRQDIPAFQENASRYPAVPVERAPSPRREPRLPNLQPMPEDRAMPPIGGWYSPATETQSQLREPISAPPGDPQRPQPGRVSSEGRHRGFPLSDIPEAYRPTQASYMAPTEPVGPPFERQAPLAVRHRQQPSYEHQSPSATAELNFQRQSSYGSDVSQLSRQLSGHSDVSARAHSVSPIQSQSRHEGHASPRENRSASIDQELARSPPGYSRDPIQWATSRPQGGNLPQQPTRNPSGPPPGWYPRASEQLPPPSADAYGQQYTYTNSGRPRAGIYQPNYPYTPETPNSAGYPYNIDAQQSQRQPYPAQMQQPYPPQTQQYPYHHQTQDFYPGNNSGYASPPYSPEGQAYNGSYGQAPTPYYQSRPPQLRQPAPPQPAAHGQSDVQQQQPPAQLQRKPVSRPTFPGPPEPRVPRQRQPGSDSGSLPPPPQMQPPQVRSQATSSYVGRRDDPAAGEEELQMRGASYPGQEWAPSGLGGSDWD